MINATDLTSAATALIAAAALSACSGGTGDATNEQARSDGKNAAARSSDVTQVTLAKREKCYGIAKAGENDCKAAEGSSCAHTSLLDYQGNAWQYTGVGECEAMGGSLTAVADNDPPVAPDPAEG